MQVDLSLKYEVDDSISSPDLPERYHEWQGLFQSITHFAPNSLQLFWGYKFSLGLSFSIVAPAGMGKSLFGITCAIYWAKKRKKSYLIVPTSTLVKQFWERLSSLGEEEDILVYWAGMRQKEKEKFFRRFKEGRFKILLTSSSFLVKHFDELRNINFQFIFVDDIDAFLKASKNVERVLYLLNFSEEEIKSLSVDSHRRHGQLIVSTATARPGKKAKLFSHLLNFGVGRLKYSVRRIDDVMVYCNTDEEMFTCLKEILARLGGGVLIFTPSQELAHQIADRLGKEYYPFTAEVPMEEREEIIKKFEDGEIKGLIGLASPYGLLVRGLDLPFRIKYVIFYRPPLMEIDKNEEKLTIVDVISYIQGAGRCSRLTPFGITHGYSFVLGLKEELDVFYRSCMVYDLEFKTVSSLDEIDFEKAKTEIENSRKFNSVSNRSETTNLIKPVLLVVESPTKARQISSFFGRPAFSVIGNQTFYETAVNDIVLIVTASIGHVLDLREEGGVYGVDVVEEDKDKISFHPVYSTIKRCPRDGSQFVAFDRCPVCGRKKFNDASQRIRNIVSVSRFVDRIYLASDPDREGEKIAYDLYYFLPKEKVYRIELHEITKKALSHAFSNPREVNRSLVMAQVCRRVEDRWIGFSLSSILRTVFREKNLSAGRAQSPVLHWIVGRTEKFFTRVNKFFISLNGMEVEIEDPGLIGKVIVDIILSSQGKESLIPPPPFATDELLRESNRIFHLSTGKTMRILQDLFECGLITYHRTDSHTISDYGYNLARLYLEEDFKYRVWQKEPSAHECIRPTRPLDMDNLLDAIKSGKIFFPIHLTREHLRIYDLIFRRFMASLTKEIIVEKKLYQIKLKDNKILKEVELCTSATGKAYELYPWQVKVLAELPVGQMEGEIYSKVVPLAWPFTQAEVISEMKTKGIGRPSTYAFIIERLFLRHYIVEKKNHLYSTEKGKKVDEFLFSNYQKFVYEERTREMEKRIDQVETEIISPAQVLYEVYQEIAELIGGKKKK